jgi:hypothetical protein
LQVSPGTHKQILSSVKNTFARPDAKYLLRKYALLSFFALGLRLTEMYIGW